MSVLIFSFRAVVFKSPRTLQFPLNYAEPFKKAINFSLKILIRVRFIPLVLYNISSLNNMLRKWFNFGFSLLFWYSKYQSLTTYFFSSKYNGFTHTNRATKKWCKKHILRLHINLMYNHVVHPSIWLIFFFRVKECILLIVFWKFYLDSISLSAIIKSTLNLSILLCAVHIQGVTIKRFHLIEFRLYILIID